MEEQLASLHEEVEKISEKISESHNDVAVQLRELISRRQDASDDTSEIQICHTAHQTTRTECPSSTTTPSTSSHFNNIDGASIRTSSSSLSIRSVRSLIPSWGEELKSSRPYKRLLRRGVDLSSGSVFSKDSSATKGDTWSMLSDLSLGDLSISEISVLELPISLSDLYDPIPYQVQQSTRHKKYRRRVNWSPRGRLHRAIREGNIFTFRTLLSLGADPEETNGYYPLLVYAARGSDEIVFCRLLLDRGAQVDTRDSNGRTALSYCARLGNYYVCQLLLDRGAAVDSTDSNGRTPLSYCAELGHVSVCKLLLGRGAAVDAVDSRGCTPLSYYARFANYYVCQLLLDRGAAVNSTDFNGRTPLSYFAELHSHDSSHQSLCKLFLDRGGKADLADFGGRTPLWYAQKWGVMGPVYQLLVRASLVKHTKITIARHGEWYS